MSRDTPTLGLGGYNRATSRSRDGHDSGIEQIHMHHARASVAAEHIKGIASNTSFLNSISSIDADFQVLGGQGRNSKAWMDEPHRR
jgi:hypothetical protein